MAQDRLYLHCTGCGEERVIASMRVNLEIDTPAWQEGPATLEEWAVEHLRRHRDEREQHTDFGGDPGFRLVTESEWNERLGRKQ